VLLQDALDIVSSHMNKAASQKSWQQHSCRFTFRILYKEEAELIPCKNERPEFSPHNFVIKPKPTFTPTQCYRAALVTVLHTADVWQHNDNH